MPEPPPPALNAAIKAAMEEASDYLMKVVHLHLTDQLKAHFDREELEEYERVYQRYETLLDERERDKAALIELDSNAQTDDQKFEYVSRLLAIVERHTDQMHMLATAFNKVIQSHRSRKKNGE